MSTNILFALGLSLWSWNHFDSEFLLFRSFCTHKSSLLHGMGIFPNINGNHPCIQVFQACTSILNTYFGKKPFALMGPCNVSTLTSFFCMELLRHRLSRVLSKVPISSLLHPCEYAIILMNRIQRLHSCLLKTKQMALLRDLTLIP